MIISPLPRRFIVENGIELERPVSGRDNTFWVHILRDKRRGLVVTQDYHAQLSEAMRGNMPSFVAFEYDGQNYWCHAVFGILNVIENLQRPLTCHDAMAFAKALNDLPECFSGGIYSSEDAAIFPDIGKDELVSKDVLLGRYLTGGIDISAEDVVALQRMIPRFSLDDLIPIVSAAGISPKITPSTQSKSAVPSINKRDPGDELAPFVLPGRKELEDFFNEHVVDVVADEERYASLGIGFPGSIILEGPTGCGKTFAVEKLVDHLGWSRFDIDASSIASPYIHETSRKVSEIFANAIKHAPAAVVIDEMDAFLMERGSGSHNHQVEEIAEFLRRIPEAVANRVLVIGMTNKLDMIDAAILRRGRFDHVIHVGHAGPDEVEGLLSSLLDKIPHEIESIRDVAVKLSGRPLSDAGFVVREAGRLAARAKRSVIGNSDIDEAMNQMVARDGEEKQRIGF